MTAEQSTDTAEFIKKLKVWIVTEKDAVKESLARGIALDDPAKHPYWVGQYLAYVACLDEIEHQTKKLRFDDDDEFETEDD